MPDLQVIIEQCLAPLEGDSPAGKDIKRDLLFGLIKDEVGKLSGDIDWEDVINNAHTLLAEKSKDINVAGFLALALFRKNGYAGLAAGLKIYRGILADFDGEYFPKGKNEKKTGKVRRFSLEWLQDENRLTSFIGSTPPKPEDAPYVLDAFETISEIRELIADMFKPPITLSRLLNSVGAYRGKAEEVVEAQKSPSAEDTPAPSDSAETGDSGTEIPAKEESAEKKAPAAGKEAGEASSPTAGEEKKAPSPEPSPPVTPAPVQGVRVEWSEDPFRAMIGIAAGLREENPASSLPYRLLRFAKWEKLEGPPPGGTLLAPRSWDVAKKQFTAPDPANTLNVCERFFANPGSGLWWLDLQRAIAGALEKSGPQFARAADAVVNETVRLVRRFPGLMTLEYKDGMPFADDDTRAWLEDLTMESGGESTAVVSSGDELGKELGKAEKLAGENKLPEALGLLQKQVNMVSSGRDAFRCRLLAGRICLKKGRPAEAGVIFEDLYRQAVETGLARWEPMLFLDLCTGLEKYYRRDKEAASPEKIREIQESILRINLGFSLNPANLKS